MNQLNELFYKTNKLTNKWSNYFEIYHRHFDKFLNQQINLLEIGIDQGGSLELWHEYFKDRCNLFAIDINPYALTLKFDFTVDIAIGNQTDHQFWTSYIDNHPKFDIVIDDGGHTMDDQLTTLIHIFPQLNDGGILLVEDTHTSYWPAWGGELNNPNTFIERSKSLIDLLHRQHIQDIQPNIQLNDIFKDLYSISFYNSVVVFEKKTYQSNNPVYNK